MFIDYKNILGEFADEKYLTLGAFVMIFLWAYSILRVAKDITNRTRNNRLRFLSLILVAATGPLGLPLYILIRPYGYLYEKKVIVNTNQIVCESCNRKNDISNDFCMFCGSGLKIKCKNCKYMYPSNYQYCCKCGAPNL